MIRVSNYGPLLRAVGVLSAVGILVTSVTYAALQSQQAVLSGNTIKSATADLRIGTTSSTFSASRAGFSFANVVPGGPAMPADGHAVYLKNYGTVALAPKLAVASTPTNPSAVDLHKVSVQLTRTDSGAQQLFTLQSLIEGQSAGGRALTDAIASDSIAQYRLRVVMDADAFSGQGADIGGIDLVFSGTPAL